jgi:Ribbon-helix-helix protein, copG family
MRTTITLDDRLLDQLKRRAAESGTSVSKLVEQAVRLFVRTPRPSATPESFELVTFGAGGRFSRQNIDKTAALLEAEDLERFASRR